MGDRRGRPYAWLGTLQSAAFVCVGVAFVLAEVNFLILYLTKLVRYVKLF